MPSLEVQERRLRSKASKVALQEGGQLRVVISAKTGLVIFIYGPCSNRVQITPAYVSLAHINYGEVSAIA